jgi:hydrophobic/amphiphilic exporter-1 (mainly G- bacteria), HAE1 family
MHPIEAFVRNPVKVWVGVLLVVLFGAVSWSLMPMQLTPEVTTPTITIETRWPGASPQEVEKQIVQEQEEQLKGVEDVVKMSSESMDSVGRIILEFSVGTDLDVAVTKVSKKLDQVLAYPEDAKKPVITTSSSSDSFIAWFILSQRMKPLEDFHAYQQAHPETRELLAPVVAALETKRDGLAELRLRRLVASHGEQYPGLATLQPPPIDVPLKRKFAEDTIEAAFERVGGVANSNVVGGRDPELQVVVDAEQLAARQLTIQDVRAALRAQNKDTSAGDLWEGKSRWVVRTIGQFRSPQDVEDQLLAVHDGQPVYIRDVAEVVLTHKKPDGFVKRFGTECIAINVVRRTGANVLEVMDQIKVEARKLNEGILADEGLVLTQVYDETDYIHSAVGMVRENIFSGAALTMIVLMMFLHLGSRAVSFAPLIAISAVAAIYLSSWFFVITLALILIAGFWFARGALVVSLAIPVSIIGTFIVMQSLGRSMNVISLAGMAFAVGMLVDNAVVVLENIVRHYQDGESPLVAAERGAREVWMAVMASTLTTLAVFLPVIFIREEAGQLFGDIALAICGAIALSLVVSITVVPVAASMLLKPRQNRREEAGRQRGKQSLARRINQGVEDFAAGTGNAFAKAIDGFNHWLQRSVPRKLALVGIVVCVTVLLSYSFWPKVEYLPNGNRNLVFGVILPPPGYNLDTIDDLGKIVENELQPLWDHDPGGPPPKFEMPDPNMPPPPGIEDFFYVARGRTVFMGMRSQEPLKAARLIPAVQMITRKLPGSFATAQQSSLFQQGLQGGRSIDIEITGPELTQLVQYGGMVIGQVKPALEPEIVAAMAKYDDDPRSVKEKGLRPDFKSQAMPKPSLDLSSPEVHVVPKLVQSHEMQLSANDLGYTVDALVDGAYAGDYFDNGEKIDMSIVGKVGVLGSTSHTQEIASLPIAVPGGRLVPIEAVANVILSSGPEQVNRRERQRAITIQVTPPMEMALEDALNRIDAQIVAPMKENKILEPGYQINLSGTADKLTNTWKALRGNLILATIITYLLMAALFESWTHPFVIILTVPLGAVGGILGLKFLNLYLMVLGETPQALDVLTMLGFVILIGTVVNNPILIVDQALQNMRERGMNASDAVMDSARTRIRPIFMTTLTTLLGLSPLVLFPGAGSELYRGLGSVLLGGLLVSTMLTLIFIPTLFSLMSDAGAWLASHRRRDPLGAPMQDDEPDYEAPSRLHGHEEESVREEISAESSNGDGVDEPDSADVEEDSPVR